MEFTAAGGNATDNCGVDESSFTLLSEVSDGATCPETVTRTYQIADLCGNLTTCEQRIVIDDDINPTLSCPGDLTAVCDISEVPPYASYRDFEGAGGSSSDNCAVDTSSFMFIGDVSDMATCPETVTRTYQIADSCGNIAQCTQLIVISDMVAPMLTCPADETVEGCSTADVFPPCLLYTSDAADD